ncbi:AAA-like domain-containing protein [Chryseobacterium sp. YIM B08800]|uniref:AAA-like domain-containing protein n=1 Tax=Chryseobacterium sp. YIM B08800 TaxID=2984136 RepID=UPI00223FCBAF|nr:AAA-like domain-containing protein [Chryseobacterium sp. YIM B08800]
MNKEWISPNIIIGKEATGKFYFRRKDFENEVWKEIEKGNNVLLAAPRRVGKTSVMKFLTENPKENYKLIFRNVQGIDDEKQFYKTIYDLIIICLDRFTKSKNIIHNYFKKMQISEISTTGFSIETKDIDYLYEINNLIPQLEKDGENIILLIDELPEVLHNLYLKGQKDTALNILKNLRHWRQEEDFKKIQFVLAGSIGIHYVVNAIAGRSSDINDLYKIIYQPLTEDEFDNYITSVTKGASIVYDEKLIKHLKSKIQYFVPYFINLILDEIDKAAIKKDDTSVAIENIDEAFNKIIKNSDHFSDWKKRLKDYLPKNDFLFINEILTNIAHHEQINIQKIYDIAVKYEKETEYMDFIKDLEQDGYIVESQQNYIFISPFLKEYWKQNNPIPNA